MSFGRERRVRGRRISPSPLGGEGRVRGPQCFNDPFKNARRIPQHLIVPKAEHAVACRLEEPTAGDISILIQRMMPAVDLDDQPHLCTAEVHDKRPDRVLTAELDAADAPVAEEHPHSALGIGLCAPQPPRVGFQVLADCPPHPALSPPGDEGCGTIRSHVLADCPPHPALSPSGGEGWEGGHAAPSWRAAPRSVFFMSMAMVMGPTPPGTGVMARARLDADSKSTSPASLPESRRFTPTSMTTAPSLIMSPVMKRGRPAATQRMSARRQCAPRSRVRV